MFVFASVCLRVCPLLNTSGSSFACLRSCVQTRCFLFLRLSLCILVLCRLVVAPGDEVARDEHCFPHGLRDPHVRRGNPSVGLAV